MAHIVRVEGDSVMSSEVVSCVFLTVGSFTLPEYTVSESRPFLLPCHTASNKYLHFKYRHQI